MDEEIGVKSAENPRAKTLHNSYGAVARVGKVETWKTRELRSSGGYEDARRWPSKEVVPSPRVLYFALRARRKRAGTFSAGEEIRQVLRPYRYLLAGISRVVFRRAARKYAATDKSGDASFHERARVQRANTRACAL